MFGNGLVAYCHQHAKQPDATVFSKAKIKLFNFGGCADLFSHKMLNN